MKKTLHLGLIIILICLTFSVSYALYTFVKTLPELDGNVGHLEFSSELYKGQDFDFDGIIDIDESGEEIYNPLATGITLTNIYPSQVLTYRLNIQNTGSTIMSFKLELDEGISSNQNLKVFSIKCNDTPFFLYNVSSSNKIFYEYEGKILPNESTYVDIKITFETYDVLQENGINLTFEEYQTYQGISIPTTNLFNTVGVSV